MRIIGLDLSLTCAGVCSDNGPRVLKPPRHHDRGMERLAWFKDQLSFAHAHDAFVLIEGYSFNSRQGGEHLGELGGVIRLQLFEQGIPFVEISPAALKKVATNKGNANKDAMVATAARLGCPADDNNAVDAWYLYQLGCYHYGLDYGLDCALPRTAYRDEAAAKIIWPTIGVAA